MHIRPAQYSDAFAINALIKELSHFFTVHPQGIGAEVFFEAVSTQATAIRLAADNCSYWVAEHDGIVIGVVAMRDHKHLFHLCVAEKFHGQGIAGKLWEVAKAEAISGGQSAGFSVNSSLYAQSWYQRCGFQVIGERAEKDGIAYVPMYLTLQQE